ncbi:hypothetical protein CkaCkLH20_13231 [Colletotrichum karsti]|uniref:Uncharacterized protein n=1 Tax=Colletotrichum karsti TaxID=1095194 RepID=A0A9P6HSM1_9PEZI|nr:uncharacterized protein CkaCkLH20_13231 [Colletotrichum karsti]KAF9869314.1 hypothetical protein CkaCkLH20_13231 [Colletotrichum karsti]
MIPNQYSAREILEAVDRKRRDALLDPYTASTKEFRSFRKRNTKDRMALVNLKRTCKAYSKLPIGKHFGHVPIGIHAKTPLEAMKQVCEMIALLLDYPDMALCVRQLYFCVESRCDEDIKLPARLQDDLVSAATSSAVNMNLDWRPPPRTDSISDILKTSCESEIFLGLGMVLLMRLLPNVEHLVLAAHVLSYNWINRMFPAFGGAGGGAGGAVRPCLLSSIRSFTFQGDSPTLPRGRLLRLCDATGLFQQGSELFVQDLQVRLWREIDTSEDVQLQNLSSLVLSNVWIELEALEKVVDRITRLTKFILTNLEWQRSARPVPAACDIIDALEKHADSLETLVLRFAQRREGVHRPVKSLAHFTALENLWIRSTEFRDVKDPGSLPEPADMNVIMMGGEDLSGTEYSAFATLPRGLKRLHVAGSASYVGIDLDLMYYRLRDGDPSVKVPDDFRLDGRHANSRFYIDRLLHMGFNVGDEVDRRPDSW